MRHKLPSHNLIPFKCEGRFFHEPFCLQAFLPRQAACSSGCRIPCSLPIRVIEYGLQRRILHCTLSALLIDIALSVLVVSCAVGSLRRVVLSVKIHFSSSPHLLE